MYFVAGCPISFFSFSLCRHCTNRVHCTHINLKIVCSVWFCLCTPHSIPPASIYPAVVWIKITTTECACRHSSIWYCVVVLYTYRSTNWTTNIKQDNRVTALPLCQSYGATGMQKNNIHTAIQHFKYNSWKQCIFFFRLKAPYNSYNRYKCDSQTAQSLDTHAWHDFEH